MRKLTLAAIGMLALAGCGPTEEPKAADPASAVNAMTGGNDLAVVLEMTDAQRRLVFARALMDADIACDGVLKAVRLDDQNGVPVWRAECKNGTSHAVSITPDGTANIVSRPTRR